MWGGKTHKQNGNYHAQGSYSMLQIEARGIQGLAMSGEGPAPESNPRAQGASRTKSLALLACPLLNPNPESHPKFTRNCAWISWQAQICPRGWRLGLGHKEQTNPEVFLAAPGPWVFCALSALACDRRQQRGGRTQLKQRPGWRD